MSIRAILIFFLSLAAGIWALYIYWSTNSASDGAKHILPPAVVAAESNAKTVGVNVPVIPAEVKVWSTARRVDGRMALSGYFEIQKK